MNLRFQSSAAGLGCWCLVVALGVLPLKADIIDLRDGGVLVGKILNPTGGPTIKIETDEGAIIEVDRKLARIRTSMERDLAYVEKVKTRGDSLEDHRAIVEECMSSQMLTLANAHRERIVELDPSDRLSWDHLKYFRDESTGKWIRREVVMYKRGKIKGDKGRWYTWQEKSLMDLEKRYTEQRVSAEKELMRWLKALDGNARQQAEAQAYFQALSDPLVIKKLLTLFQSDRSPNRVFYLSLLEQMPASSVASAMVVIAMEDPDIMVVNRVLDFLELHDESVHEIVMMGLAAKMADKQTRERAAYCMARFPDQRFTSMLIGSLLSSDLVRPAGPPPGSTTAGFSTDGGVGFSGGAPAAQQRLNQHKNVLAALTQWTGENFGYDIPAWRQWFAQANAAVNLDLRRDDY